MGKKQKKKRGFVFKFFITLLIILIVLVGICAGAGFYLISNKLRKNGFRRY